LEDRLFEGLSVEDSKNWPLRFVQAVPVGKDLSGVLTQFRIKLLEECLTYDRIKFPEVDKAVHQVIQALKNNSGLREARDNAWAVRRKIYAAAAAAAAYAAADAAYAAADAAYAAADAAYDAAYAAYAAADADADAAAYAAAYAAADAYAAYDAAYAAYAAAAAARRKMWLKISNVLVECLEAA
jgi:hypothetical protein